VIKFETIPLLVYQIAKTQDFKYLHGLVKSTKPTSYVNENQC